jgi:hypothetical protein
LPKKFEVSIIENDRSAESESAKKVQIPNVCELCKYPSFSPESASGVKAQEITMSERRIDENGEKGDAYPFAKNRLHCNGCPN